MLCILHFIQCPEIKRPLEKKKSDIIYIVQMRNEVREDKYHHPQGHKSAKNEPKSVTL